MATTRGAKVTRKCKKCKDDFIARVADVNRGWAKFCSKSCKASHQEKTTGQYRNLLRDNSSRFNTDPQYEGLFNDAHLFSNEE